MPTLRPLADEVWEARSTLRTGGAVFPIRMTVLRVDGGLVLWSPVAIDDALAAELDALGPVTHLVGPNLFHHLHLRAAKERYPRAQLLGAPGLPDKRGGLTFDGVLDPSAPFASGLDLFLVDGVPKLSEVVALHRASGTVVVTDFVFNMLRADNWMGWIIFRLLSGTLGRCAQSRLIRWLTKDRDALRQSVDRLLGADFDRLVMAHGEVIDTGGREALLQATEWLRRSPRQLPVPPIY